MSHDVAGDDESVLSCRYVCAVVTPGGQVDLITYPPPFTPDLAATYGGPATGYVGQTSKVCIRLVTLYTKCLPVCVCVTASSTVVLVHDAQAVCEWLGAEWQAQYGQSFDNVAYALDALFQISTTEGWVDLMNRCIDSRGELATGCRRAAAANE